jgi:hypothetical protein
MKRALLLATPVVFALVVAGCPFTIEWGDECVGWDCGDCVSCSTPDPDPYCPYDDCSDGGWVTPPGGACVPGSTRYCDTASYCSWGEQMCLDDGSGWSECYEAGAPPGCGGYSYDQDCCMASGSCCQDWWDADGDGDIYDSVGNCEEVPVCDDDSDCPAGYCAAPDGAQGICQDTGRCATDAECAAFGPGLGCDDRGICIPEESPCPSGECGCESDAECEGGMMCIESRCTDPSSVCFFDFECGDSSRCLDNECHATCTCDVGCATGQFCSAGLCLDSEVGVDGCVYSEDCGDPGLVCINATCFKACDGEAQCHEGETCRGGACRADVAPVHDCGGALGECGDDMVCNRGVCRLPCAASINCSGEMSVCGGDGFCVSPVELGAQCMRAADCASGQSCLGNTCTSLPAA